MRFSRRFSGGLTLIELIVSMVLVAILVAITAIFLRLPMESNFLSRLRVDLTDSSELALRHLDQELRQALPNSVRVTTGGGIRYIEFLATRASGRYRLNPGSPAAACPAGAQLGTGFAPANDGCFTSIGQIVPSSPVVAGSDYVVIGNDGPGFANNAYIGGAADGPNKARIIAGGYTALLAGAAPAESRLRYTPRALPAAPGNLFYIVSGPVTYMCDVATGSLLRYAGYPISAVQQTPPPVAPQIMVSSLTACDLNYGVPGKAAGLLDQGIVSVTMTLSRTSPSVRGQEAISLVAQIPVDKSR